MNKIIYQFCYHNHRNHFEMLDRIVNTLEYYKEMNEIKRFTYNQDFFKKNKEVILVDIIPDFINPEIHSFDVNESEIKGLINNDPNDKFIHIWREYEDNKKPHSWRVWPYSTSKGWCERIENKIPHE